MKTTIKALDHYDALQAGHTYELSTVPGSRMTLFTDLQTARLVSLYRWQVEDGALRGKLVYVDDVQSPAMCCAAVDQLCHKLPSGYAY